MKRFLAFLMALALLCGVAMAESFTPTQYLEKNGYMVYQVGGVTDIGIDEATFAGKNSDYSLCGCLYDGNSKTHSFFWRESDGGVYVAKSAAQPLMGAISPALTYLGTLKIFVDMCDQCGFSLGLYLEGGYFIFGMPDENADLVEMAKHLADGRPMAYRVGWENYLKALTLPGLG